MAGEWRERVTMEDPVSASRGRRCQWMGGVFHTKEHYRSIAVMWRFAQQHGTEFVASRRKKKLKRCLQAQ